MNKQDRVRYSDRSMIFVHCPFNAELLLKLCVCVCVCALLAVLRGHEKTAIEANDVYVALYKLQVVRQHSAMLKFTLNVCYLNKDES